MFGKILIGLLVLIFNLGNSQELNIKYLNDRINLGVYGNPNVYYIIQSSTDFINWKYLDSIKTDSNGVALSVDTSYYEYKFYRLKESIIGPKMIIINTDNYFPINGFKGLKNELRILYNNFPTNSCAVLEEDVEPGLRKLIVFAMQIVNAGDCDWRAPSLQERPDLYHFAPCHGHYHLLDYSKFTLSTTNSQLLVSGKKQGWCAMPIFNYYEYNPVVFINRYSCTNTGMLPGWGDIYQYNSGMWIDITNVENGNYIAHFEIDPLHLYGDGGNASLTFLVNITGDNITVIREL